MTEKKQGLGDRIVEIVVPVLIIAAFVVGLPYGWREFKVEFAKTSAITRQSQQQAVATLVPSPAPTPAVEVTLPELYARADRLAKERGLRVPVVR
jgi:hypothetical protein